MRNKNGERHRLFCLRFANFADRKHETIIAVALLCVSNVMLLTSMDALDQTAVFHLPVSGT